VHQFATCDGTALVNHNTTIYEQDSSPLVNTEQYATIIAEQVSPISVSFNKVCSQVHAIGSVVFSCFS
jgi:hypothetical protein